MRYGPLVPMCLALSVPLASPASAGSQSTEVWNRAFAIHGRPNVHVTTDDAFVHVETWDLDSVDVQITTTRWHIGPHGVRVESHLVDDRYDLRISHASPLVGLGSQPRSIRVQITIPRRAMLSVKAGEGVNVVANMRPAAEDPLAGNVEAEGVEGITDLSSKIGTVSARGMAGRLSARTTSGTIHVEGRFDALTLASVSGAIGVTAAGGSTLTEPWSLASGPGSVSVRIATDLDADLDVVSSAGRLIVDPLLHVVGSKTDHSAQGKLNRGGRSLLIRTTRGSIWIGPQ